MAAKTRTNLTSLERLERQLQGITPDRAQGDAWEKALKGWINAGGHPELTKAWMWGEWPGKLKAGLKGDKGVDLVAETRDKQLVAIQVKFRRDPNDAVTAPEVQKLVGSYRKHFTLFALASNAWSATRGVSEAVGDEDAMLILREQLLESSYDWAAKKSIKRTKFTPFPFQKLAAENARKALAKGGRAQIVMACGTGKTVTMLLAAEALDAQRVLVLAPTLLLVKQLRDEWISKRRPDREWASLAVCSDIGDGVDASEIAPAEFGAPPTTNPDDIAAFLKKPGRRVVFGTYASSDRIAKAQKKAGVPSFDLAVADEAHRIAGVVSAKDKSERSQRVMLEEKEIKAVRRLFATATPRITGSKKTREGDDILIESMDDESRFGKVAHSVTFQEAVKLKRLVPYKLVVTIVTKDEVDDLIKNRRFIDVNGKAYAADEVATAIAIRRAYKDLGISKIISYHSRVAGARAFSDLITQVPGRGKSPVTEHVAGSMPVNDRRQVLKRLAAATEPYLVTNARCLTEGVDVPALDAVAFVDPKKSQVDIVQAVGRAMRRPMGTSKKTTGYIILPVYLLKKDLRDPEAAVEGSAFEPVLQVLRALKAHDPYMAEFMADVLLQKGKRPRLKGKAQGMGDLLQVSVGGDLNSQTAKRIFAAVELQSVRVGVGAWMYTYIALSKWAQSNGHCRPLRGTVINDVDLGGWVLGQRSEYNAGKLPMQRIRDLEKLPGWSWDALEDDFQKYLAMLKEYVSEHGTSRVPVTVQLKSYPNFGKWVAGQRAAYRAGRLPTERRKLFEELPGWTWEPFADDFAEGVTAVRQYLAKHGFHEIKKGTKVLGVELMSWCLTRRNEYARGAMPPDRIAILEKIPGWRWEWSAFDFRWQTGLQEFRNYFAQFGNGFVPVKFTAASGFKLGSWCNVQRTRHFSGKIRDEQEAILSAEPGWAWDGRSEKASEYFFSMLPTYEAGMKNGIRPSARSAPKTLTRWWAAQLARYNGKTMPKDQIDLLEAIPGHTWTRKSEVALSASDRLRDDIDHVVAYVSGGGSADLASTAVDRQGRDVGMSVQRLRQAKVRNRLSRTQVAQLSRLHGWRWAKAINRSSRLTWEDRLKQAASVAKGKSLRSIRVNETLADGFRIGKWVSDQVSNHSRGKLDQRRAKLLMATPGWYWGAKN
jgi:superfamily II DNA or RNA helicase